VRSSLRHSHRTELRFSARRSGAFCGWPDVPEIDVVSIDANRATKEMSAARCNSLHYWSRVDSCWADRLQGTFSSVVVSASWFGCPLSFANITQDRPRARPAQPSHQDTIPAV
jgi:hypothetical protein